MVPEHPVFAPHITIFYISLQAPVHFLVIPKKLIVKLSEAEDSDESILGQLMTAGKKCAANSGLITGFWIAVNEGPQGRQTVSYLHLPVLGNHQQDSPSV
uniref:HIT domain-containing protein n=1 Tax=Apteryx owenii TaxID=8824 RepID=A0A8B9Q8A0_APTOW